MTENRALRAENRELSNEKRETLRVQNRNDTCMSTFLLADGCGDLSASGLDVRWE
jgi:hypothetical protein